MNAEMLKLVAEIVSSIAVTVGAILLIFRFAPTLAGLIASLAEWRGETNTKLEHLTETMRDGFKDTKSELHGVRGELTDHGERIASLEGGK